MLRSYLLSIEFFADYIKILVIDFKKLNILLQILKKHSLLQFNVLSDIACVDFIKTYKQRFEINYLLLSIKFGVRIIITINVNDSDFLESVSNVYSVSNWFEREIYDLFGLHFFNHPDLRRILTDYGFDGYPFRKDFPLNGYVETRYDDSKQYLAYEPVEFMQQYRIYDFINPFFLCK